MSPTERCTNLVPPVRQNPLALHAPAHARTYYKYHEDQQVIQFCQGGSDQSRKPRTGGPSTKPRHTREVHHPEPTVNVILFDEPMYRERFNVKSTINTKCNQIAFIYAFKARWCGNYLSDGRALLRKISTATASTIYVPVAFAISRYSWSSK